jgi:hypothetical protein
LMHCESSKTVIRMYLQARKGIYNVLAACKFWLFNG